MKNVNFRSLRLSACPACPVAPADGSGLNLILYLTGVQVQVEDPGL